MDIKKRIKFAQLEKFEEFGHCGMNNPHLDVIFKEGYLSGSESQQKEIEQLREEIRMLKQYAEIAKNDKQHRKKRLNKALEEIKQLKTK